MAYKKFSLPDGTSVTIYKRKASRSVRLSVTPEGEARVSIPRWSAYAVGLSFAVSRLAWIQAQRPVAPLLANGQRVGKAHRLFFVAQENADKVSSRVAQTEVTVTYPTQLEVDSPEVQDTAKRAVIRALRAEAESLLPKRLNDLAMQHGFSYGSVSIKQMKSRWGSCDRDRNIVLNLFLVQLPWEQIDYVLLHELTHTEVLRHGPDFWQAMERILPEVKQLRKVVRSTQPLIYGVPEVVS